MAKGASDVLPSDPGAVLVGGELTDASFAPAAVIVCWGDGDDSGANYTEVEVSAGVGVPAGLGSLDAALAGIGSSGSVGKVTSSLGS